MCLGVCVCVCLPYQHNSGVTEGEAKGRENRMREKCLFVFMKLVVDVCAQGGD